MPLLEVSNLRTYYKAAGGWFGRNPQWLKAVDDVSFSIRRGETFGLVGESGCGKSTLGRSILRLERPRSGQILFEGEDLLTLPRQQLKRVRRDIQAIFQDPFGSLDPRMTVRQVIAEGLIVQGVLSRDERDARIEQVIDVVGLRCEHLGATRTSSAAVSASVLASPVPWRYGRSSSSLTSPCRRSMSPCSRKC